MLQVLSLFRSCILASSSPAAAASVDRQTREEEWWLRCSHCRRVSPGCESRSSYRKINLFAEGKSKSIAAASVDEGSR